MEVGGKRKNLTEYLTFSLSLILSISLFIATRKRKRTFFISFFFKRRKENFKGKTNTHESIPGKNKIKKKKESSRRQQNVFFKAIYVIEMLLP